MTPVIGGGAWGSVEKLFEARLAARRFTSDRRGRDWTLLLCPPRRLCARASRGAGVSDGRLIGYVGDTGDAGPGNYHLHFGLTRTTRDQRWYQGTDVDPFPYLAGKQPLR